ncbi:YceI family protein [Kribbella sp. NPDC004536]|uniref:YceI family protein n=1 Tax=Kribbella sp. NPDC004536 TaxID=3364106 RepID=UPI0036CD23BC
MASATGPHPDRLHRRPLHLLRRQRTPRPHLADRRPQQPGHRQPRRFTQLRKDAVSTGTHPVMTFESTEVKPLSATPYNLAGNLTLRSTTHP